MLGDFTRGRYFKPLNQYIHDPAKVAFQTTFNMGDINPTDSHIYMRSLVNVHGHHTKHCNAHIYMAWAPEENPSQEQQLISLKRSLDELGLGDHYTDVALHKDRPHKHLHAAVCLVHPESGEIWRDSHSKRRLASCVRRRCNELGFRIVETPLVDQHLELGTKPKNKERYIARTLNTDVMRIFDKEEIAQLRQQLRTAFDQATTWEDLQERIKKAAGVELYTKGQGLVISDVSRNPNNPSQVKLSQLFRDVRLTANKAMREAGKEGLEERFQKTWTNYVEQEGEQARSLYDQQVVKQTEDKKHRQIKSDTALTQNDPFKPHEQPILAITQHQEHSETEDSDQETETTEVPKAITQLSEVGDDEQPSSSKQTLTETVSEDDIQLPVIPTPKDTESALEAPEPIAPPKKMFEGDDIRHYQRVMTNEALAVQSWEGMVQLARRHGLKLSFATILSDGKHYMYLVHLDKTLTHRKLAQKFGQTWSEYKRQSQVTQQAPRQPAAIERLKQRQVQRAKIKHQALRPNQPEQHIQPPPEQDLEPEQDQ